MNNEFTPPVPSSRQLAFSCLWATLLASFLLVAAVLPAEYGVDLLGLGKVLGLNQLASDEQEECLPNKTTVADSMSMKEITPEEMEAELGQLDPSKMEVWQDTVTLVIPPLKSLEYKFYLHRGQSFDFLWATQGEAVYFDLHGDPKAHGHTADKETSFKIDTANQATGSLTAPFAGQFGWYWENKSRIPLRITLKTRGDYRIVGRM